MKAILLRSFLILFSTVSLTACNQSARAQTPAPAVTTPPVATAPISTAPAVVEKIGRSKILDPIVVTIDPAQSKTLDGPIYVNTQNHKQNYGNDIVKIILQEAHSIGAKYLEYGDLQGYYSWLVLSLTVPLHEGLYVHFRKINHDLALCSDKSNYGEKIASKAMRDKFVAGFHNPKAPFLVKACASLKDPYMYQLLSGGGDGSDIGIMQLNSYWHYNEFMATGDYRSVRKTVRYGLNHLMSGFRAIYANFKSYGCLVKDKTGTVDMMSVIRGSWSGKYNAGNVGHTCRFANSNSPHATKDAIFFANLKKTLGYSSTGYFGFSDDLRFPLNTLAHGAILEILKNFSTGSNENSHLKKLIGI